MYIYGDTHTHECMYTHTFMYTYIYIYTHTQMLPHPGTWTHITWSLSRSTPTASSGLHYVYANGVFKTSSNMNYPIRTSSINYIAKSHWASDAMYKGDMDSFTIYPWVLRDSDAKFLFESTGIMVCMIVCACMFMHAYLYMCVCACVCFWCFGS